MCNTILGLILIFTTLVPDIMARMRALTNRTPGKAGVGHGVKKAKKAGEGKKNINSKIEKARLMTKGILEVGRVVPMSPGIHAGVLLLFGLSV